MISRIIEILKFPAFLVPKGYRNSVLVKLDTNILGVHCSSRLVSCLPQSKGKIICQSLPIGKINLQSSDCTIASALVSRVWGSRHQLKYSPLQFQRFFLVKMYWLLPKLGRGRLLLSVCLYFRKSRANNYLLLHQDPRDH